MGQYYKALVENLNNERTVYDTYVGEDYMAAKLMEHSWWKNPYVNGIAQLLYKNPMRLAWVGDYANDAKDYEECYAQYGIYDAAYGDNMVKEDRVQDNDFMLDGKYLVNHSQKTYLNCDTFYMENSDNDNWCINPLSLLTAIGNGLGGGDYRGVCEDSVGDWAWELISVEDEIPDGYDEVMYEFKE